MIIRDLQGGSKRFGELKNSVGSISPNMLTNSLRDLESDGLVIRTVYAEIPPRVEYTLTSLGMSFTPIISALGKSGFGYKKNQEEKISDTTDVRGN